MAELVFGAAIDASNLDDVRAWLTRHHVPEDDQQALIAGDLPRLWVYRKLVRSNLDEALRLAIPRSVARLGTLWDETFDAFLAERGTRTHYLRDVTGELLDFCAPRWANDARFPPYLMDLARHEALHIEIGAEPSRPVGEPAELTLERGVRFTEAARVMRYRFAVHELPESPADESLPAERPTALFSYRSPEHEVRYLELTPLAAAILDDLLAGRTLHEALTGACEREGHALDAAVLESSARLLSDLAERAALLGAA